MSLVSARTVAERKGQRRRGSRPLVQTGDPELDQRRRSIEVAFRIGMMAWPLFFFLDVYIVYVIDRSASLSWFVFWRSLALIIFALAFAYLRRYGTTHARLTGIELALFGVGATALSLMAIRYGGLNSRYLHGVSLVLLVRSAAVPGRWERAAVIALAIGLTFPVVLGVAAPFDPHIAAQWRDPAALALFAHDYVFVVATAVLGAIASHMVWSARQQVFEARRLGRYRLKARIAEGGMGEVWLATDQTEKRDVALKILASHAAAEPQNRARFQREARAAASLDNPHVVRVLDFGASDDGVCYIAMELLEGRDLSRLVLQDGPLAPARAIHFVRQACAALAEAHERGVVHRDIKPENLFVTGDDFLKLVDFGIAKVAEEEVTITRDGWLAGTPAYMSPEMCTGATATPASDLYSLGAVLYFLLTGTPPFQADNAGALMVAHVQQRPEPPSVRAGANLPDALDRIVLRCLAKQPAARFPTAIALDEALAALDG